MKAAVRCESLDLAGLARAEKHGKREDWIGKQRQIRKRDPVVAGGMDLVDRYEKHVEGARQNKAAKKPVLHFIVRFPPEVLTDDGPTPFAALNREGREKLMVKQAVTFINKTHGGHAVFAARLDRDEAGETIVDVFACPKYMKPSKSGRRDPALWTSATKFGEELARKHQEHIRERLKNAETTKPITSPRAVGMALQQDFAAFFERENGVKLEPRKLKESRAKDRIEVEEWRLRRMEQDAEEAQQERDAARLERDEALKRERAATSKAARITSALQILSEEIAGETIGRDERGDVKAQNLVGMREGFPEIVPAVRASADMIEMKKRVASEARQDREAAEKALVEANDFRSQALKAWAQAREALKVLRASLRIMGAHLAPKARQKVEDSIKSAEALMTPEEPTPEAPRGDDELGM